MFLCPPGSARLTDSLGTFKSMSTGALEAEGHVARAPVEGSARSLLHFLIAGFLLTLP